MAAPALAMARAGAVVRAIPTPVKIGIVVIILLIVVYFAGKIRGKNKERDKHQQPADLPTGGYGIPAVGIDAQGNAIPWNPEPIVDKLKSAMWGWDWNPFTTNTEKVAAMGMLHPLTNDQLITVWNRFNDKYAHLDYGNLRDWIEDESWPDDSEVEKVLLRMDQIGLYRSNN